MKRKETDDLRPEYEFDYSKVVRGKYYKRLLKEEGSSVVVLERDVAKRQRVHRGRAKRHRVPANG